MRESFLQKNGMREWRNIAIVCEKMPRRYMNKNEDGGRTDLRGISTTYLDAYSIRVA